MLVGFPFVIYVGAMILYGSTNWLKEHTHGISYLQSPSLFWLQCLP
jgi:hypothetical protein